MSTVTFYYGDCLDILPTLEAGSVDTVITDPPYFVPVNTYVGTRETGYERRTIGDLSVLQAAFVKYWEHIAPILKPTGSAYVFCDAQSYPLMFRAMFPYFKYVRLLIWDKCISYNGYTWRHQHELIAWGEGFEAERMPTGDGDVLSFRGVLQKDRCHPAEKPLDLILKIIPKCGDVVLDPFMGSGTTGVACVQTGRNFIGIEIDEGYFDIAQQRIAKAQAEMVQLEMEGMGTA